MDIAKYIGLFLLKNKLCYIPGMGNLEIKKTPAVHDGEVLKAPAYDVRMTPSGSIDDSLANFVATNEKISIASASNAIRDFATASKAALNNGEIIAIPSLGHFTSSNGKMEFVADPNFKFTPAPVPTVKHAPRAVENIAPAQPTYNYGSSPNKTNWGKTIIWGIVAGIGLGVLIAGGIYMLKPSTVEPEVTTVEEAPAEIIENTPPADNVVKEPEPVNTPRVYKVILNTYSDREKAEKRHRVMTNWGNTVELVVIDSNTFHVLMPITAVPADTARLLDSLRVTYNPTGVSIYN